MEYILYILVVLEFLKELFECRTLLGSDLLEVVRYALEFRGYDLESVVFEVLLYVGVFLESTVEHYLLVA